MPLTNDPNPDPDPGSGSCYFRHRPSRCQQKTIFLLYFFCLLPVLFEGTFTSFLSFLKIKSKKETQNSRNQDFSFCMMMEGSRSGSRAGSIPLTNGSGSRRPRNLWIRIRNTDNNITFLGRERSLGRRPTGPGGLLLFARPEGGLHLLLQGPVPASVRHEAQETRPR